MVARYLLNSFGKKAAEPEIQPLFQNYLSTLYNLKEGTRSKAQEYIRP